MHDNYAHDDWDEAAAEHQKVSQKVRVLADGHPAWDACAIAAEAGVTQQYAEAILRAES